MNEIMDFFSSALPWIAIGLFAAIACARMKTEKEERSRFLKGISWLPVGCFLLAALLNMYRGNPSGGTTWLVLAIFNAFYLGRW